jgi:hypothetical protein
MDVRQKRHWRRDFPGHCAKSLSMRPRWDKFTRRRLLIAAVGCTICLPVVIRLVNANERYFPDHSFDDFVVERYARHLKAMKEPSLWNVSRKDRSATVYRFLWLPTFDHPISVRVVKSSDHAVLDIVKLDGRGGYEPGGISVLKSKKLTDKQWDEFERRLEKAQFWTMSTEDKANHIMQDGDRLILEGVLDGTYHVVHRDSPALGSDYAELCRFLLDQSGLKLMKTWKEYRRAQSE